MRSISEAQGFIDISKGISADFNKLIKSFTTDIINVFNATNKNEEAIKKNQDALIQENLFLQRKIKELEEKMKTVEAAVNKVQGKSNVYKMYKTFYTAESIVSGPLYHHDPDYGIITIPYKDQQSLSLSQYPIEFLRKNIDLLVEYRLIDGSGEQIGPTTTITLNDNPELINILDKNNSTYWFESIIVGDNIYSIDFKVIINMPLRIIPNIFVNSVGIKPHPIYSLTLKDIKYTDANSNNSYRLPTYPTEIIGNETVAKPIEDLENIKFMFPTIATNKLEFTFSQPYYIQSGDKRIFIIGLKGIDIENMSITSEEASFIIKLELPGEGRHFSTILEPSVIPLTDGIDYGDLVTHELIYDLRTGATFPFGSQIASNRNEVYIKTTIRRDGEYIPAIRGLEIGYLLK